MSDKILKLSQAQTLYQDLRARVDAIPPIDNSLSDSSTNSVQNKVINEELKKKVDLISNTVTGNPCTFNSTIGDIPLKSIKINWTPSQSGSGDPSPQNPREIQGVSSLTVWRTGANLIDDSKRSSAGVGYSLYIGATSSDYTIYLKAGTYRFTAEMLNGASYDLYFRKKNGQAVYIWMGTQNKTTATFTIPYDGLYRFNMTGADPANVGKCWVTYGEDETQYSPYTGTTIPVTFPALGKNLLNPATIEQGGIISSNGTEYAANNRVRSGYIPVEAGKKYTLSATGFVGFMHFYNANKGSIGENEGMANVTAPEGAAFARCGFRKSDNVDIVPSDITDSQLEEGSTATSYEPYTSTVYGGTLDLTTGVLTVEYRKVKFSEFYSWGWSSQFNGFIGNYTLSTDPLRAKDAYKAMCAEYKYVGYYGYVNDMQCGYIYNVSLLVKDSDVAGDIDAFNTKTADYEVAYELNTPYTIQLTPTQIITALVGDNTIWSDTNGSIEVENYVDLQSLKDYIDEQSVHDVQINGTSILNNGVADVPLASDNVFGVMKIMASNGIALDVNKRAYIFNATSQIIKTGTNETRPITPNRQQESVFYGLAKAAGADMKDIANTTVGTYPDAQKAAIQNMLGITDLISTEESSTATAAHALNSTFMMNGRLHRATAAIAIGDAVVVGTNCEVVKADEVFVKKTDYASTNNYGLVIIGEGLGINSNTGKLQTNSASTATVKQGSAGNAPIVPGHQHESVFYGLSKVAGVDLKNETVTLGTYPETSKTAIRSMIGAGAPLDVQINGTSIVNNGVANIPIASTTDAGVVKMVNGNGLQIIDNKLYLLPAGLVYGKSGNAENLPVTSKYQHISVFYGLTKAAGVDMASSSNEVGVYTDAAKTAIRAMLGATSSNVIAVQDEQPTDMDTKVWLPETESTGIEVPTYAEFQALDAAVVKKTDYATASTPGIVKTGSGIVAEAGTGKIYLDNASESVIKGGTTYSVAITPVRQHIAAFYGLSKAAGVDLASETVTVGTYPATASAAIRSMLGAVGDVQIDGTSIVTNGIAEIPKMGTNTFGVAQVGSGYGIGTTQYRYLYVVTATDVKIKAGTDIYSPITASNQEKSVFYGLAKAAGDTTMSSSSNAVGTYTNEAKAAIHTMLSIDPASIAAQVDIPLVETVSGTTPTITGQPNVRYVCGEVSTITITPPASGSVDVIFESGSTATTMTVPSTVKWPAWFDAEALEANTTYEVLITDGIYGSVMTWTT